MLSGILWLLFLPNTIYIVTDVTRIAHHWNTADTTMRILLILQYICLELIGLVSFLLAFLPFEKIIRTQPLSQKQQIAAIILFNSLIAFGMVLGRMEYINSWVVFTHPAQVIFSVIEAVASLNLWGLTIVFWMLCNGVYFLFRAMLVRRVNKFL